MAKNIFGLDLTTEEVVVLAKKETAGGAPRFEESFVGEVKILDAEINTAKTGALSLQLTIQDTEKEREQNYLNIWFQKSDGDIIPMGLSKIAALGGLTKKTEGLNNDPKVLIGSIVGVFLKMIDNGRKFHDFEIEGFYSVKANKTWGELKANLGPGNGKIVDKMNKRYEETPVSIGKDRDENLAKRAAEEGTTPAGDATAQADSSDLEDVM